MPRIIEGIPVKKAPHLTVRPAKPEDQSRDGSPINDTCEGCLSVVRKKDAVSAQNAVAIPVNRIKPTQLMGRWHIITDFDGKLIDGRAQYLWWSAPMYFIEGDTVYHGTIQFYPSGVSRFPDGITCLELELAVKSLYIRSHRKRVAARRALARLWNKREKYMFNPKVRPETLEVNSEEIKQKLNELTVYTWMLNEANILFDQIGIQPEVLLDETDDADEGE